MGDPLPDQSDNTESNSTQKKKIDTRLASGQHTFPFSFPFPTHADPVVTSPTSDNGPKNTGQPQRKWTRRFSSAPAESSSSSERPQTSGHPPTSLLGSDPSRGSPSTMPQTFMEKDIEPNVAYHISFCIVHGRFKISSK